MAEIDNTIKYVCELYLAIADQLLSKPEGVVPQELDDHELFKLLSNFYLEPVSDKSEFLMI